MNGSKKKTYTHPSKKEKKKKGLAYWNGFFQNIYFCLF